MYEGNHSRFDPNDKLALRIERLYEALLRLDDEADIDPVLTDALRLTAAITRSDLAYLEVFGEGSVPTFARGHATTDASVESIRSQISRAIVSKVVAEQRPVEEASTVPDTQVVASGHHATSTVRCVPFGRVLPAGILYIRTQFAFSAPDRARIDWLARRLARIVHRLVDTPQPKRQRLAEEVRELQERRIREAMERHDEDIAKAARDLGVGRAFVYRVLRRERKEAVYPEDPLSMSERIRRIHNR